MESWENDGKWTNAWIMAKHKHQNASKTFKNSKRQSRDAQNIPKPIHQKQNHAAYRRKNHCIISTYIVPAKKHMLTSSKDFMPGHSKSQGQSCTWSRFLARAWSHVLVSLCMQNLQGVRQESHNLSFVYVVVLTIGRMRGKTWGRSVNRGLRSHS